MKTIRSLSVLFVLFVVCSCLRPKEHEPWRHVWLQPIDSSQVLTIITEGDRRYIIDGKQDSVPTKGYLLLDLSKVDRLGDAISVCWDESGYRWKVVSAYADVLENNLDTTKFLYYESLGEYGEPSSEGYTEENCGGVLIRESSRPRGNLVLKYKGNSID